MIRPVLTLPPKVKTLAQQKADFTAEGSPPPGKVAMSIPDTPHESVKAISRAPTVVLGAHKRRPSGKNRCRVLKIHDTGCTTRTGRGPPRFAVRTYRSAIGRVCSEKSALAPRLLKLPCMELVRPRQTYTQGIPCRTFHATSAGAQTAAYANAQMNSLTRAQVAVQ
jgi:hypothetical protein